MFRNPSFSAKNSSSHWNCTIYGPEIFLPCYITFVLLFLPLCFFILHRGFLQWRQQRSSSSASTMSHSDSFTYLVVTLDLVYILGYTLSFFGIYRHKETVKNVGYILSSFSWYGETFFHTLTCLERYLAVVHPITYMSLRGERGVRIRNISIAFVWLLSTLETIVLFFEFIPVLIGFGLLCLSFITTCFCTFSVLCVLIRPGPGEQGRAGNKVDKTKERAFYTIIVITGTSFIRCIWHLIWTIFYLEGFFSECLTMLYEVWFNIPSHVVLPLLYLQREGLLGCFSETSK